VCSGKRDFLTGSCKVLLLKLFFILIGGRQLLFTKNTNPDQRLNAALLKIVSFTYFFNKSSLSNVRLKKIAAQWVPSSYYLLKFFF